MLEQQWWRFIELARTYGLVRSAAIAAQWLIRREYLVLVRDLALPLPNVSSDPRLRWTTLTVVDIPDVCAPNPSVLEAEVRGRLEFGHTGLLCWVDNTLAHYRWDTTSLIYLPYLGLAFRPHPGDFFAAEAFTRPSYRGLGIHSLGTLTALRRAVYLGCKRSITLASTWNAPAIHVNSSKAGRATVGRVGFWTCGFGQRYFGTGAARLVYIGGSQRPVEFEVLSCAGRTRSGGKQLGSPS